MGSPVTLVSDCLHPCPSILTSHVNYEVLGGTLVGVRSEEDLEMKTKRKETGMTERTKRPCKGVI